MIPQPVCSLGQPARYTPIWFPPAPWRDIENAGYARDATIYVRDRGSVECLITPFRGYRNRVIEMEAPSQSQIDYWQQGLTTLRTVSLSCSMD